MRYALGLTVAGCGYNKIPTLEEQAKAKWADVQNNYQRRADLIPNLVATVQGYAKQEKEVLTAVVEARAKATQVKIDVSQLTDPEKLKQFQDAQNQLSGALGRLLAISENYPDLKSNQNFLALQSQLEGTENRIAVARRDYIEAVRLYNTELKTFPGMLWAATFFRSNKPMAEFTASENARQAAASEILTRRRGTKGIEMNAGRTPSASREEVCVWPSSFSALLCTVVTAFALTFPALTGRVVDQANIIPADTRTAIEQKLADLEAKSGIQLVVATVTSLEGQEIEPYANELFRSWKLGEKTKNNGVLLLVAPNERRVRIEVGYGLEGTLTDALSKVIITNAIAPRFKAGDFGGGISRGVDDIITVLTTDASEWQQRPSLRLDNQQTSDPASWFSSRR